MPNLKPELGVSCTTRKCAPPLAFPRVYQLTAHRSILKHPDTNFTVISNPDDGHGSRVWPSGQYIDAIEMLNKFLNVQALGYINIDGGKSDNVTVRKEIETYAGWSNVSRV
jgi:hypothetical protein